MKVNGVLQDLSRALDRKAQVPEASASRHEDEVAALPSLSPSVGVSTGTRERPALPKPEEDCICLTAPDDPVSAPDRPEIGGRQRRASMDGTTLADGVGRPWIEPGRRPIALRHMTLRSPLRPFGT